MSQIQLPSNAIPVSFDRAIEKYAKGDKILSILSDKNGVYAAHAYSEEWGNLDRRTKEFKQYKEHGKWYLLS